MMCRRSGMLMFVFLAVLMTCFAGTPAFAVEVSEEIPKGAVVVDFEGPAGLFGADFYVNEEVGIVFARGFVAPQEQFDLTDEYGFSSGFSARSPTNVLVGDMRPLLVFFDPSIVGVVMSVGGFYTGQSGRRLVAYGMNREVIGQDQAGICCDDFVSNMRIAVETKSPIWYLEFQSQSKYGFFTIDDFFFVPNPSSCFLRVPLYLQTDKLWKMDQYGSPLWSKRSAGRTIEHKGCAVTSSAMVLSYYGGLKKNGPTVTPRELNDWLRADEVGYVGGDINWSKVQQYAQKVMGIDLWYRGTRRKNNSVLTSRVCGGEPMILDLDGHFVVANGSYNNTWFIKDPLGRSQRLDSYYGNWYKSTRWFSTEKPPGKRSDEIIGYILVSVDPDVGFTVTDSSVTSYNHVVGDGALELVSPVSGDYILTINSVDSIMEYVISMAAENGTGSVDSESFRVLIPGDSNEMSVRFSFDDASNNLIQIFASPVNVYLPIVSVN